MVDAVEQVRQRMLRATSALRAAGVSHAVVGGNAVAAWVATVDRAAVRTTQDVDILISRQDLNAARNALERAGFVHRKAAGLDLFLDGADASPREAVHVVFADETIKTGEPVPSPGVHEATDLESIRFINLDALVRIKLTAFRRKDQVHLLDMIGVGLIDQTWIGRLHPILAARLQTLLDDPNG